MKKIFLFAAAVVAALTVNAKVYDLSTMNFAQSDLTVTGGEITDNASKSYFEVKNNAGETVEMKVAQLPNMVFSYKNSSVKTAFKVYYNAADKEGNGKIQMDGNQRDITISNVKVGDKIILWVNSKGDTGAQFVDGDKGTAFTGCAAVDPSAAGIGSALPGKANETDMYAIELQAIASTVIIRETVGGYVLHKIQIGEDGGSSEAIDNIEAGERAVKFFENGQLIILKNGVRYNALGAKL
ncbi:MAG: hypothetical protein IJ047_02510 [Paludibacteraceae bacterium]|nr:hypothetical protein [Paludibacteraceae bacterium]